MYLWACLALGVGGVLVWVAAYASIYPSLSKTISEHIDSLSVFDKNTSLSAMTSTGAKWIDVITVASQATAEIFLSAVLGMYMTMIYARHRPVRLAGNPLFIQLDQERIALEPPNRPPVSLMQETTAMKLIPRKPRSKCCVSRATFFLKHKDTKFTKGARRGIIFLEVQPLRRNDQGNSKVQGGARNGDEEGRCRNVNFGELTGFFEWILNRRTQSGRGRGRVYILVG